VQREKDHGVSNRYFRYAAANIPHPSKRDKGGEDAWLAQEDLLVVADGVGGWAN
jgi:protein phosphatase PTC7